MARELLVALPGDGDLPARVAGSQAGVQATDLACVEVLHPADVERAVRAARSGYAYPSGVPVGATVLLRAIAAS